MMWTLRRILILIMIISSLAVVGTLVWVTATHQRFAIDTQNEATGEMVTYLVNQRIDKRYLQKITPFVNEWSRLSTLINGMKENAPEKARIAANRMLHTMEVAEGRIRLRNVVVYTKQLELFARAGKGVEESLITRPQTFDRLKKRNLSQQRHMAAFLWQTPEGRPVHSLIVPIGGFQVAGFIEFVTDPIPELSGMGDIFGGIFRLLDTRGNALFESKESGAGKPETLQETLKIKIADSNNNTWAIATITRDTSEFKNAIAALRDKALWIVAGVVLGSILVGWLLLRLAVFGRLQNFALAMESMAQGETEVDIPSTGPDEFRIMENSMQSLRTAITERNRAEDELKKAKEQAEKTTEMKSEFVAMVSHEIRTPMNGVLGMANLLRDMRLNSDQQECADTIVASGEALLTIIDDLLDVSKLDADKLELEHIPFAITDVVGYSMAVMAPQAEEKGLQFTNTLDPDIPEILVGDPYRLRQVLLNLISNAIKFTDEGSVTVKGEVTTKKEDGVVIAFFVSDTGQGISDDAQEKLFAEYTQASMEVARKHGGTGLGLSISRRLIALMGGEISIVSAPGKGSTFSFVTRFDIADDAETIHFLESARSSEAKLEEASKRARLSTRSLKILQVEDNKTNRDVAEKILTKAGHRVTNVENGLEALEVIETGGFDVLLMDRDMPIMDGIEATKRIRAMTGPLASIPIVGITASAIQEQLDDCINAGMNVCLTKPVDARKLHETLEQYADKTPGGAPVILPELSLTVLVIDDTEINRTVAAKQLVKLGCRADLAGSGAEGLKMAEDKDYDLILADISMPEMDGLEFTRLFRQSQPDGGPQIPVIAMTGHKTPEDRAKFLDAGMDGVLTKPVAIDNLSAELEKWLTGNEQQQENESPAIDLKQLSEILGEDDEGELFEMLGFFTDQFPGLLASLEGAVNEKDAKAVRDRAHAAKSAASSASAVPLAKMLEGLEKSAKDQDWDDIIGQTTAIYSEYGRVEVFCAERGKGP